MLCKVLSYPNGCNSLWNWCQPAANEFNLWWIEGIINGICVVISSYKFWREKYVSVFCCKQLHWGNDVKELSGKCLNCVVEATFFFWGRVSLPFSTHWIETTFKKECFTMSSSCSDSQIPFYKVKPEVYPYSISQRNFMQLNVRNEGTAVWQIQQYKCHSTRKILSFLT